MNNKVLGIRQKNHLNIRCVGGQKWVGQMFRRPDDKFCTFEDELFGYRAALCIICKSYRKRGIVLLSHVISTWAPKTENNTKMYFAFVLARLLILFDNQKVNDVVLPEPTKEWKDFYVKLIHAMAMVEIGACNEKYIDDEKIATAYEILFLGKKITDFFSSSTTARPP